MNNRRRGHNYEREVVNKLKTITDLEVGTTRNYSTKLDNKKVDIFIEGYTDIVNPELGIQCKLKTKKAPTIDLREWENIEAKKKVLLTKMREATGKKYTHEVAVVDIDFFYELLECYFKSRVIDTH